MRCGRPCSGMLGHPSERHRCDIHRTDVNMSGRDSKEKQVTEGQNQVRVKMLKVKNAGVENKWWLTTVFLFSVMIGYALISCARSVHETIDEVQRYVRGKPTKIEEVMNRLNETAEKNQRLEDMREAGKEHDKKEKNSSQAENMIDGDSKDEYVMRLQTQVKVKMLKIISEEIIEDKKDKREEEKGKRTLTTQTEMTYQFWKKNPRYVKKD